MSAEWTDVVVSASLTLVGLYFAWNYRRQLQVSLATKRLDAYRLLWERTGVAAPTRLDQRVEGEVDDPWSKAMSMEERKDLYGQLTDWYYSEGNGMLLSKATRAVYLAAKNNLVSPDDALTPRELRWHLEEERGPDWTLTDEERGCLSIRELSLLRSQMRADLAIYGKLFVSSLQPHELAFLTGLRINVLAQPWSRALPSGTCWSVARYLLLRWVAQPRAERLRVLYRRLERSGVKAAGQTGTDPVGVRACIRPIVR